MLKCLLYLKSFSIYQGGITVSNLFGDLRGDLSTAVDIIKAMSDAPVDLTPTQKDSVRALLETPSARRLDVDPTQLFSHHSRKTEVLVAKYTETTGITSVLIANAAAVAAFGLMPQYYSKVIYYAIARDTLREQGIAV